MPEIAGPQYVLFESNLVTVQSLDKLTKRKNAASTPII
jgi:hypothetical protein